MADYDFVKEAIVAQAGLIANGKAIVGDSGVLELTEKGFDEVYVLWQSFSAECKLLVLMLLKVLKE